jgi:hypothetical protein
MNIDPLETESLRIEAGYRVLIQVPENHVVDLLEAVSVIDPLAYGHYDRVSFRSTPGLQNFRPRPGARGGAFSDTFEVPCLELSFLVSDDRPKLGRILEALYQAHPYEEPVILIQEVLSTRFRNGEGSRANPKKYWNRPDLAWVPEEQRS